MLSRLALCRCVIFTVLVIPVLVACGGDGSSGGSTFIPRSGSSGGNGSSSNDDWVPGVFLPASTFKGMCASPVPGTDDIQGTSTDENNFLRSYSNNTYLWYDEIVDRNPALYTTPDYFDLLRTDALTSSGNFKDKFHFTLPTDEWLALSQAGRSIGYGAKFALFNRSPPRPIPPRRAVVAYTEPGTPATAPGAGLVRGTEILTVDGVDLANGSDVETLSAGLYPETIGESHTFRVRDPDGTERTVTLESATITASPVQNVSTFNTVAGKVGYFLFNDHIATSEGALFDAITELDNAEITGLIVDIRYNGGGYLAIASELAYMIAGAARTAGQTFEDLEFNDKYPDINPVTGQALTPRPFHTRSLGFDPSLPAGTLLPSLNLGRVYVLTGPHTCSASESVMNSLRGIDVEVIQVGETTCGKPYGFYTTSNCGTTYFTIQFKGVNNKGFGDYTDGFSPANTASDIGTVVPGCSVADDFMSVLGDPAEARLAAALNHMETGSCPAASTAAGPFLLKSTLLPGDGGFIQKSLWQQNRIMRVTP